MNIPEMYSAPSGTGSKRRSAIAVPQRGAPSGGGIGLTAPIAHQTPNKPTNPAIAAITNEPALGLAACLDRHARRYPIETIPTIPAMIASPNNFSGGYITALYVERESQSM